MELNKIFKTETGRIIISLLLGLGLATLFRKVCKNRDCIVFHAPDIEKIKGQIFKFNDKCYTFKEKITKCKPNKKIVEFA